MCFWLLLLDYQQKAVEGSLEKHLKTCAALAALPPPAKLPAVSGRLILSADLPEEVGRLVPGLQQTNA